MAAVRVERAVKSFIREDGAEMRVLDGVTFEARDNGITCLLGPSGCGKSTLLNAIAGLEKLDAGKIEFQEVSTSRPKLGYVFQDPRLLNWKRVEGNLTFAFKGMNVPREEWRSRLNKYLELVGLAEFRRQYPLFLSGGMRQRVGLARALAIEPEVLLMDEPFSKLDQLTARRLRRDTLDICARLNQTALLVTHDVEEAAIMGDRIVIFSARPARIVEVLENPLATAVRDPDEAEFVQFKKRLLNIVLKLIGREDA
ncbi:MAG TPA: ABC transporter ATP-binding protein [Candidatus Binatia bacterium]|nr:ABC transporter ATP-binding protein [Candidatus Binatia bacterium]